MRLTRFFFLKKNVNINFKNMKFNVHEIQNFN